MPITVTVNTIAECLRTLQHFGR